MILLDTHAWIWWRADPCRLSAPGADVIAAADRLGLSAISVWELGMLVRRGRISLDRDIARWVRHALADARVTNATFGQRRWCVAAVELRPSCTATT